MNGKNLQELIKNLQVFYKCPSCGAHYRHEDITFLGKVDEHCFMQLTCKACSLPILATVLLSSELKNSKNSPKIVKRIMKSDLKRGEKRSFEAKQSISSSEIADLYLYFQSHPTDLHKKF